MLFRFSYNPWNVVVPKCHFFCSILVPFLGLHVKGQVGLVFFSELWPLDRRIGASRIPENEAKSVNDDIIITLIYDHAQITQICI